MSKRLDILGARIFGASVCHARNLPGYSENVQTFGQNPPF